MQLTVRVLGGGGDGFTVNVVCTKVLSRLLSHLLLFNDEETLMCIGYIYSCSSPYLRYWGIKHYTWEIQKL